MVPSALFILCPPPPLSIWKSYIYACHSYALAHICKKNTQSCKNSHRSTVFREKQATLGLLGALNTPWIRQCGSQIHRYSRQSPSVAPLQPVPLLAVPASPAPPAPAAAASPPPSAPGSGAGLRRPAPGGGAAPAAPAPACRSGASPPPAAPDGNCATVRHRPRHDGHAATTLEHTGRVALSLLLLLLLSLLLLLLILEIKPDEKALGV